MSGYLTWLTASRRNDEDVIRLIPPRAVARKCDRPAIGRPARPRTEQVFHKERVLASVSTDDARDPDGYRIELIERG